MSYHHCASYAGSSRAGPPPRRQLTQLPGSAPPPAAGVAPPGPRWGSAARLCSRPANAILCGCTAGSPYADIDVCNGWNHASSQDHDALTPQALPAQGYRKQTCVPVSNATRCHVFTVSCAGSHSADQEQCACHAHLLADHYQSCVVGHGHPIASLPGDGLRCNQGHPSPHCSIAQAILALQASPQQ